MTLEQLRIFVAVAERQHMTAAARSLGLTQSAVSSAIAGLEQRYDTRLFHRIGRRIALTQEGEALLGAARGVMAQAAAAEQVLTGIKDLKHGVLRVRASQTVGSYWLPRFLVDFRVDHPEVAVDFAIGNTAQVAAAVRDGVADLGIVEGVVEDAMIRSEVVARDRLMVVVGSRHPWAGRKRPKDPPKDLFDTTWILRETGSGTRAAFEAGLAALRLRPAGLNILLELPSNEAVRSAVIAGTSATVLSASVVVDGLEAGLLHQVKFDLPERAYSALMHTQRYLGRPAEAFLKLITAARKTRGGP